MAGTLQIEVVKADQLTVADRVLWRAMTDANPDLASPYFRWEFTEIASKISPDAAVAILSKGGRTIGYFPHQRRGSSIQPLGAPMNDYHGVIAMPGEAQLIAAVNQPQQQFVHAEFSFVRPLADRRHQLPPVMPQICRRLHAAFGVGLRDIVCGAERQGLEADFGVLAREGRSHDHHEIAAAL